MTINFKNFMAFMAVTSLVITPGTTEAKYSKELLGVSLFAATATGFSLWKVYVDECKEFKKTPSKEEFGSFILGFFKNKETRAVAYNAHPALLTALYATLVLGTVTAAKGGYDCYDYFNPEVEPTPDPEVPPIGNQVNQPDPVNKPDQAVPPVVDPVVVPAPAAPQPDPVLTGAELKAKEDARLAALAEAEKNKPKAKLNFTEAQLKLARDLKATALRLAQEKAQNVAPAILAENKPDNAVEAEVVPPVVKLVDLVAQQEVPPAPQQNPAAVSQVAPAPQRTDDENLVTVEETEHERIAAEGNAVLLLQKTAPEAEAKSADGAEAKRPGNAGALNQQELINADALLKELEEELKAPQVQQAEEQGIAEAADTLRARKILATDMANDVFASIFGQRVPTLRTASAAVQGDDAFGLPIVKEKPHIRLTDEERKIKREEIEKRVRSILAKRKPIVFDAETNEKEAAAAEQNLLEQKEQKACQNEFSKHQQAAQEEAEVLRIQLENAEAETARARKEAEAADARRKKEAALTLAKLIAKEKIATETREANQAAQKALRRGFKSDAEIVRDAVLLKELMDSKTTLAEKAQVAKDHFNHLVDQTERTKEDNNRIIILSDRLCKSEEDVEEEAVVAAAPVVAAPEVVESKEAKTPRVAAEQQAAQAIPGSKQEQEAQALTNKAKNAAMQQAAAITKISTRAQKNTQKALTKAATEKAYKALSRADKNILDTVSSDDKKWYGAFITRTQALVGQNTARTPAQEKELELLVAVLYPAAE